jgi:hypothetical protein
MKMKGELLPDGWEKQFTEKGKVYFIDHNTKETHWKVPVQAEDRQDTLSHTRLLSVLATEDEENQV